MPHKHLRRGEWTGKWMGQIRREGERIRKLFETKAEALAWEADMRRGEICASSPAAGRIQETQTATISLIEWSNRYLDFALRYRPKVYSEKRFVVKRLLKTLPPQMDVAMVTPDAAMRHLQAQFQARSGYAANKERKNLVAAWGWGQKFLDGFPSGPNPFQLVPMFPADAHDRYVPPEADFWRVVDVARGQDRVMLLTLYFTAGRRNEIHALKWADVDFVGQRIRLKTRKRKGGGQQEDWLPMVDELCEVLLEHRKGAAGEWVFPQEGGRFEGQPFKDNRGFPQIYCRIAGVPDFDRHSIRHLAGSVLARSGVAMIHIQPFLRHKKLATTEQYLHGGEHIRPHLALLKGGRSGQKPNTEPNKTEKGLGAVNS